MARAIFLPREHGKRDDGDGDRRCVGERPATKHEPAPPIAPDAANWQRARAGQRRQDGLPLPVRVDAKGDHFEVYFDGQKVIDANDQTFKNAGKIGLWTKADSVTYFEDLAVAPL